MRIICKNCGKKQMRGQLFNDTENRRCCTKPFLENLPDTDSGQVEAEVGKPFYFDKYITLYCGDARDYIDSFKPDVIITDPPYPTNKELFLDGIEAAKSVLLNEDCEQLLTFWDYMQEPVVKNILVAKHISHKTNTNQPTQYEMIYHYHRDSKMRGSRVLSYPVIYKGLTGCKEATGHPTQKNYKLMQELIVMSKTKGLIYDPFAGSGSTLFAAKQLGLKAVGVEINPKWCEVIANRLSQINLDFVDKAC